MPGMETMKDRIRTARKAARLTQDEVAHAMGVSRISMLNWENKGRKALPETHRLPLLAETLGVRMDWLVSGKGPMSAAPESAPIPGSALDRALLYRVIVAIERHFAEHTLDMAPEIKGETVLAVYDWAEKMGAPAEIDIASIASLLRLAHPKR